MESILCAYTIQQYWQPISVIRGEWSLTITCKQAINGKKWLNTLRPREIGRHFADNIFKWIFLNKNVWISINISLKFVPRGSINDIPTLVQVMAWRWPGDKPLSEPKMVRLPTHICVTRPQWVNRMPAVLLGLGDAQMHRLTWSSLVQLMAIQHKSSSKPMLTCNPSDDRA